MTTRGTKQARAFSVFSAEAPDGQVQDRRLACRVAGAG